jgi:GT2 family glycosyltransferase
MVGVIVSPAVQKKIKTFYKLLARGDVSGIKTRLSSLRLSSLKGEGHKGSKAKFLEKAGEEFDDFIFSGAKLFFSTSKNPKVTILIILYNKAELTFQCLRSLQNNISSGIPCELLIIDNGSSDRTSSLLRSIEGARIIRNSENIGFLRACNQAIQLIDSEYFLLVNNDTILSPGVVEVALSVFEEETNVGAVGGRIILPDGTLQEAGNILWNDGTCVGFGRGFQPTDYRCMFRREVDYCSGAFLLTPSSLFKAAGGFDPIFIPAYYEETDYCAWLQNQGYKIFYEPRVSLIHFEFGSSDLSANAFRMMSNNREKFKAKNQLLLNSKPAPSNEKALWFRDAKFKKRVLFIDDRVPHTHLGAGFPRSNQVVNVLDSQGYFVTIFPTLQENERWSDAYSDISNRIEIVNPAGINAFEEFLLSRPNYYDLIWISRPHNMKLLQGVVQRYRSQSNCKLVYDAEAIFSRRAELELEVRGKCDDGVVPLSAEEEFRLASVADAVVAVSSFEAELFGKKTGRNVFVVGHELRAAPTSMGFRDRTDVVFLGSLHGHPSPNTDSLIWFLEEVLPKIRRQLSDFPRVKVVGYCSDAMHKYFQQYKADLEIIGQVESISTYLENAKFVIIPTRYAAGIPQKAFDVAAAVVPAVCTDLIAQQMNWESGKDCLACSWKDSEKFSQFCLSLCGDEALWENLRAGLLQYARTQEKGKSFSMAVCEVVAEVLS